MSEDARVGDVRRMIYEYVRSPSLRHIRDGYALNKLAIEIVRTIDRGNSIWRKWDGQREFLLKSCLRCWIPLPALLEALNELPGPKLTKTDVEQRLRQMEEDQSEYAWDRQRDFCLEIYEREKAEGTELIAIAALIREQLEQLEEREREEQMEAYRKRQEQDRLAREHRLLSGADIGWTQIAGSTAWYCRVNARTFRLVPTANKRWSLCRVKAVDDAEKADILGTYSGRSDATKAVKQMAYQPEPRW